MSEQSNAAAERSAHVLRGGGGPMDEAPSPVVEVAPGRWQLRRVWQLEQALREVIARAEMGCSPAVIAKPAREALR